MKELFEAFYIHMHGVEPKFIPALQMIVVNKEGSLIKKKDLNINDEDWNSILKYWSEFKQSTKPN